jgi:hypothetical protein
VAKWFAGRREEMRCSGGGKPQGGEEKMYMRYTAAQRSLEIVRQSDETVGSLGFLFFQTRIDHRDGMWDRKRTVRAAKLSRQPEGTL